VKSSELIHKFSHSLNKMKRSVIIFILLLVLAILFMSRGGKAKRVPGETTQAEQRQIKGMSVIVKDY
jgi:hypothetical protein